MSQGKPDADPKMTRRQTENARAAIQIGRLVTLLQENAFGDREMSPGQIKSAQILLAKRLPDMQQLEHIAPDEPRSVSSIRADLIELIKADPSLLRDAVVMATEMGIAPADKPELHVVK